MFVEWMFMQMWEYTKLTFRIFRWIFGLTALLTAWVLNRRQNRPSVEQADLFSQDKQV
jgi:hypothetical protein